MSAKSQGTAKARKGNPLQVHDRGNDEEEGEDPDPLRGEGGTQRPRFHHSIKSKSRSPIGGGGGPIGER